MSFRCARSREEIVTLVREVRVTRRSREHALAVARSDDDALVLLFILGKRIFFEMPMKE
jgi:hypothetical protein